MTAKRFYKQKSSIRDYMLYDEDREDAYFISCDEHTIDTLVNLLNELHKEKEYLKTRFHEERELAMRLSRECDTLTIKKQELELEVNRLETIIKTGEKKWKRSDVE